MIADRPSDATGLSKVDVYRSGDATVVVEVVIVKTPDDTAIEKFFNVDRSGDETTVAGVAIVTVAVVSVDTS